MNVPAPSVSLNKRSIDILFLKAFLEFATIPIRLTNRVNKMVRCKITVLKRTFHKDLAEEYLQTKTGKCGEFEDDQEFITESPTAKPDNFPCSFAWHDIHRFLLTLMQGGSFDNYVGKTGRIWKWMKADNSYITCCTDGIRPVIFKLEVIDRSSI